MDEMIAHYVHSLIKWFNDLNSVQILVTIVVAYLLCKATKPLAHTIINRFVKAQRYETNLNKIERQKRAKTLADLFSFIIKLMIILTAIYTVLTDMGINLAPVIASAGVIGVALGFGAQAVVKDMLAGFLIVLENQYRVDDVVRLSGVGFPSIPVEGTVRSITEVINRTLGYSKFRFTFAVDVGTNVDDIIKVINQTGEDMARDRTWSKAIVDAPHYDEFGTIGKEGINVTVSGTTMPGYQWKVSAEFRKRLVSNLQKSDISIADLEG